MRTKIFLIVAIVIAVIGVSFSFSDTSSTSPKQVSAQGVVAKNSAIKSAPLNGCVDIALNKNNPVPAALLHGALANWQPFSNLVSLDLSAGTVDLPFYISSFSGDGGIQTSQMWDVEFFDALPPIGAYEWTNEFGNPGPNLWPLDSHPSLVARSTLMTDRIPTTFESHDGYRTVSGSLGSVTLPRAAKYVRARLRADVYPGTMDVVSASLLTVCQNVVPKADPTCTNLNFQDNGYVGPKSFHEGGLFYSQTPSLNSSYTNEVPVSIPGNQNILIPNSYAYDKYPGRETDFAQNSEKYELEFLDSAHNVIGKSSPSEDLPDGIVTGTWENSLGSLTPATDVAYVRGHHLPDLPATQDTDDGLMVVGATICFSNPGVTAVLPEVTAGLKVDLVSGPSDLYEGQTGTYVVKVTNASQYAVAQEVAGECPSGPIPLLDILPLDHENYTCTITPDLGNLTPWLFKLGATGKAHINETLYKWPAAYLPTLVPFDRYPISDELNISLPINRIKIPV